jgi:hypothetical protein
VVKVDVTSKFLTVAEAQHFLEINGVTFSQIWIRTLVGLGKIKSKKVFSSRVIDRKDLERIVADRKGK